MKPTLVEAQSPCGFGKVPCTTSGPPISTNTGDIRKNDYKNMMLEIVFHLGPWIRLGFELVWQGKCINRKKLNVKTSSIPYTKSTYQSCYLQNVLTGHKGVTNKGCQTRHLKSRRLYSS